MIKRGLVSAEADAIVCAIDGRQGEILVMRADDRQKRRMLSWGIADRIEGVEKSVKRGIRAHIGNGIQGVLSARQAIPRVII